MKSNLQTTEDTLEQTMGREMMQDNFRQRRCRKAKPANTEGTQLICEDCKYWRKRVVHVQPPGRHLSFLIAKSEVEC